MLSSLESVLNFLVSWSQYIVLPAARHGRETGLARGVAVNLRTFD